MISFTMIDGRASGTRLIKESLYVGGAWRSAGGEALAVINPARECMTSR